MRRSLIGKNIRHNPALSEFGDDIGAIADESDGNIFFFAHRILQNAQRLVERRHQEIAIASLQALLDALGIDINAKERSASHGCRERLRSSHSAHSSGDDQFAAQIATKMFVARGVEGFVSALHDALRTDVDPRTSGHLSIHHEAGALQFVELLPIGKMSYEIRVRNQDTRSVLMRLENAYWLARLHEQRFVVFQGF